MADSALYVSLGEAAAPLIEWAHAEVDRLRAEKGMKPWDWGKGKANEADDVRQVLPNLPQAGEDAGHAEDGVQLLPAMLG